MIAHVVLFKPRTDLPTRNATMLVDALEDALRGIPTIRRVQVGQRLTIGRGYEQMMTVDYPYAVILEFDDEAGLKTYLDHPAHAQLGTRLLAASEAVLVYDFVTEGNVEDLRRAVATYRPTL